MRHDSDLRWPDLGRRFDRVRGQTGSPGCFRCSAVDLLLDRTVTVQAIGESAAPYERDLFEREADALSRLGAHAAVLGLHERTRIGELDVLVLQGASAHSAGGRTLTPPEAVRVIATLAGGVETAHRAGIRHGAIEPDAVLYGDEAGEPMLAGYLHRAGDPQPPALHRATSYTAPEILLGEPVGEAADVYGLGATLFDLLAGHPAVRSYPGESPAALSLRVITGAVATLDRSGVPFELVDVVNWALTVDPAERPPSAAWLAEELGRIERRQGWPHTRLQVGAQWRDTTQRRNHAARHRAS